MKPYNIVNISKIRPRSSRPALVVLAFIGLSACAPVDGQINTTSGWLPASSPKQLDVDRAQYRHVVYFNTDRDEIRADERDRLLAFIDAVQPMNQDDIRLEGHADERANDVYNIDLAARRIDTVKRFLSRNGLDDGRIHASAFGERLPASPGSDERAWSRNRRVEIVLDRYVVTPPACPDWSRRSGLDFANQPHSNFGCATETNLGMMIANPKDLIKGRKLGSADGIHQAEGIVRYRQGQLIELQEERID